MKFPRDFVQSQKSSSATWTVHTCDQRIVTPITTVQMASITWRIVQRTWCSARSWGNAFGQTSPIAIIRIINNIIMSKHCKSNFHPPQQRSANIYHAIPMHELRSSGYYDRNTNPLDRFLRTALFLFTSYPMIFCSRIGCRCQRNISDSYFLLRDFVFWLSLWWNVSLQRLFYVIRPYCHDFRCTKLLSGDIISARQGASVARPRDGPLIRKTVKSSTSAPKLAN